MPVDDLIQIRRGTTAQWATADPTLDEGEPGLDVDLGLFKLGDGTTAWSALPLANQAYMDALLAANDAMLYKGSIDASSNPNYPAASAGHTYRISVAGKIGGASGAVVQAGDLLTCLVDGTPAGTQAAVGSAWDIVQANIDGAVVGPAVSVAGGFALFDGTTGKLLKADGLTPANDDIVQRKAGAWTNRTVAQFLVDFAAGGGDARYLPRTDTAAVLAAANPTLLDGQWGFETDTGIAKIGDGVTAWTSLAPFNRSTDLAYAEKTSTQSVNNTTLQDLTGLSINTVQVPYPTKVHLFLPSIYNSTGSTAVTPNPNNAATAIVFVISGATAALVVGGTVKQIRRNYMQLGVPVAATAGMPVDLWFPIPANTASTTVKAQLNKTSATGQGELYADTDFRAFIRQTSA